MTATAQVYLPELAKWIEKGGEFVSVQAPLVAQDIIRAEYFSAITSLSISLVVLITCIIVFKIFYKKSKEVEKIEYVLTTVLSGVIGLVTLPILICAIYDLIYLQFFPRLVIIEHFKNIL